MIHLLFNLLYFHTTGIDAFLPATNANNLSRMKTMTERCCSGSPSSQQDKKEIFSKNNIYSHFEIDYSAANEYVEAHYGKHIYDLKKNPYFSVVDDDEKIPVYNARNGIFTSSYQDKTTVQKQETTSLDICGFTLLENCTSKVDNWKDLSQVSDIYLDEITQQILPSLFNFSSSITDSDINDDFDVVFWHPMYREQSYSISQMIRDNEDATHNDVIKKDEGIKETPKASVSPMVHIDTDVDAYQDLETLLNFIKRNQIMTSSSEDDDAKWKRIKHQVINQNQRFLILNLWRNVGHNPIQKNAPLGIYLPLYDDGVEESTTSPDLINCFPFKKPSNKNSKWYTFPNMLPNEEVLVFKQYDRNIDYVSDLWHCALTNNENDNLTDKNENRTSFDLRLFLVLKSEKEKLTPDKDRFRLSQRQHNIRPLLSLEDSGCFCDEQAAKRFHQDDN